MTQLAKTALIATALFTAAPLPAPAAFVDHQAIRACFARAQFLLTQNDGETVAADRALTAERAAKGWRVRGDVYLSAARQNGAYRIDCLASEDGVALDLIPLGAPERIDR